MFTSFTGSTRPKRQVNLSGRNANPFAGVPTAGSSSLQSPAQSALSRAHQERILRQHERERPPAAIRIQKTWRGHKERRETKDACRRQWDHEESWNQKNSVAGPYKSEAECLVQLRLLGQFASPCKEEDAQRLHHFATRYLAFINNSQSSSLPDSWIYPRLRLTKVVIALLGSGRVTTITSPFINDFVALLTAFASSIAVQSAPYAYEYFKSLAIAGHHYQNPKLKEEAILAILQQKTKHTVTAYSGFASEYLTLDILAKASGTKNVPGSLESLAKGLNYGELASALSELLTPSNKHYILLSKNRDELLWLLSHFVFFHRNAYCGPDKPTEAPDAQYVRVIARLVSFLADDIGTRMDVLDDSSLGLDEGISASVAIERLHPFIHSEILTLVNQENVTSLLANLNMGSISDESHHEGFSDASELASYALTLLKAFPRRGDEIRMWLYRGSSSISRNRNERRLPAIKYFYHAASSTIIYQAIKSSPQQTVDLLRPDRSQLRNAQSATVSELDSKDQQWRVILLFLELYTFILKVMDDEEFLSGSSSSGKQSSWTMQSALTLQQIEDLTIFLKNLSFSMYWNASEIAGIEATETRASLAEYFGRSSTVQAEVQEDERPTKMEELAVAGVSGMTPTYMKGLVTGVLRMLYERDSRRKFLPKDHWLMTKYFEMDRFIPAVVSEEEQKHQIEASYEPESDNRDNEIDEEEITNAWNLIGTTRAQQVRNSERLKRQQRKTSRRKYMESVTPRLEILQNMPFFIPFKTRVQIFREFVQLDQIRRRGTADADEWRFAMMHSPAGNISKHRAKVRREHVFDDAYEQFYGLGEGLKEPIQIRFVDKFDTIEEGIDGGGVTKEFLTSITNEAFGATSGLKSFVENDQHLLYPNPSAVEEKKESLRHALYRENSPDWNEKIRDLLRRYEFLGRIVGKCLYEGILIDIHFAPFFLLKWALTGGSGSARKESSYRANINDLRDLDEGLYQGLLQLKNYPENVEDDFSLNFAVTDTLRVSPTESKTITRELRPDGASTPVTNENRLVYISYIARHRLQTQPFVQTSAFLRGLGTIVSPSWLGMFNQSELQTLVGGDSSQISVADLRANSQYGGIYAIGDDGLEHPSVQLFWKVMQSLDSVDTKKVLKFVTSTPRAPLLGFGNLNPRFSIRDSGSDQTRLPSTSTCVNLLKLPIYKDERVLRERLLYSVNAGAGFNLS